MTSTLRLNVKRSEQDDIRTLIVRVSEENLSKLYNDVSEYRDGKPVEIEKNGKKVYAVIQDVRRSKDHLPDMIRMDGWTRRMLNVEPGQEVNIKTSWKASLMIFWKIMVFNHPDLNQRWENFGIFLALAAFLIDFFYQITQSDLSIVTQSSVIVCILILFVLGPPIILVPRK